MQCLITILALLATVPAAHSVELWEKYSKLKSLESRFTQEKSIQGMDMVLKSEGTLKFKAPDHLEWEILVPKKSKMVFDGGDLQIFEGGTLKASYGAGKMNTQAAIAIQHLKAWLALDRDFIMKNYAIRQQSPEVLVFTPIGEVRPFKSITAHLGKKIPIERLELVEASDDKIQLQFKGTKISYEN